MLKVENNVVEVKADTLAQALSELLILTHTISVRNDLSIAQIHSMINDVAKRAKLNKNHIKMIK